MDKLAEEILLRNQIAISEDYDKLMAGATKQQVIKAMQSYHEAKLKEDLIKFFTWVETDDEMVADMKFVNEVVDEYLKTRKK